MKRLELKQHVTHEKFGNGIIENTDQHGAMYKVDFNGTIRTCRRSELKPAKQNKFTPMPTVTGVLSEVQKLQERYNKECNRIESTSYASNNLLVRKNVLNEIINDLENILQGEKTEL